MDVAYDHSYQEAVASTPSSDKGKEPEHEKESLNEEFQQAYNAISNSPWGTRFGTFIGTVKKQGESYLETAKKEYPVVAEQATKGFTDLRTNLVNRTRGLSLAGATAPYIDFTTTAAVDEGKKDGEGSSSSTAGGEGGGLLEKLRKGASQRIAEIEAAEAKADEYLIKFGTNIGSFLRDAVTIAPPREGGDNKEVVFESKGSDDAKKQIFTTRLDAQLHLLHTNYTLFSTDSVSESYTEFVKNFSIDKQTEQIASDLDRYSELRAAMEKLVPGEVEYSAFWVRYYFCRNELDLEEKKRKELLKGAAVNEEEVGWDEDDSEEEDDDDDDGDEVKEDQVEEKKLPQKTPVPKASTDTLQPKPDQNQTKSKTSMEISDSEASYDLVSGAPSQSAGSPPKTKSKGAESSEEEEDWE